MTADAERLQSSHKERPVTSVRDDVICDRCDDETTFGFAHPAERLGGEVCGSALLPGVAVPAGGCAASSVVVVLLRCDRVLRASRLATID